MSDSLRPQGLQPTRLLHGIFQARVLEWVASAFSEITGQGTANQDKILLVVVAQCLGLSDICNPIDCSPPGSSIHGISQARVLEWGAIAFSLRHPRTMKFQNLRVRITVSREETASTTS